MWSLSCPVVSSVSSVSSVSNSDFLRRHARDLLRLAHADSIATGMPVLRRLHATRAIRATTLGALYEARADIQLKHVLNMLGAELGHAGWDTCKQIIDTYDPAIVDRYRLDAGLFNDHEKVWFADLQAARKWQREQGGYIVEYGDQAVAILWREPASSAA